MRRRRSVALWSLFLCAAALPGTALLADDYKVGAYYFGVWNRKSCNVCYLGNRDWWRGVREYAQGEIDPLLDWAGEDFSHLKPALGFYNNSRPRTLERQIRQARANGIDFFTFYWYWGSDLRRGRGGERFADGLRAFLRAPNTHDLQFAVAIAAHPWNQLNIPPDQQTRAIRTLVDKYLGQRHYLKTDSGRPVLFVIDGRALGGGSHKEVDDFLTLLREESLRSLGITPFLVMNLETDRLPGLGSGRSVRVRKLESVDAYSCLNLFPLSLHQGSTTLGSQALYNSRLPRQLRRWEDKPLVPCYMLGFDERPRESVGLPLWALRRIEDWSVDGLREGLGELRRTADRRRRNPVDRWLLLYAWNEWREAGHVLEPNEREGHLLAHEVATAFGLDTFGSDHCRTVGDCPESVASPTGAIESAGCDRITGWARDPDTSLPTRVELYREPFAPGARPVAHQIARYPSADLPFPGSRHRFRIKTPNSLHTGRPEMIHLYTLDLGVNGNRAGIRIELAGSPLSLTCP